VLATAYCKNTVTPAYMSQTDVEVSCCFYSISRDLAKKLSVYNTMNFLLMEKSNYELETYTIDKMVALNNNTTSTRSSIAHVLFLALAYEVFCIFANSVIFIQNCNELLAPLDSP